MQSHGGVVPIAEAVRIAAGAVLSGPAGGVAGSRYCAALLGEGEPDPLRHGRHEHGHLADRGRPAQLAADRGGGRAPRGAAEPRHREPRRRRRLHRLGRSGRHPAGRPAERGRRPRAGVLRPRRHRGHRHRRQPRAGLSRPRQLPRRRRRLDAAAAERAVDALAGHARHSTAWRAADGIHASSTRAWPRASGWSRCAAASTRGDSRCSPSAARPACTPPTSRASSRWGGWCVPRVAAVLSAWGMLATDLRYEVVRTHVGDVGEVGAAALRRRVRRDGGRGPPAARARVRGAVRVERSVDMRYGEQIFEVSVPLDGVDLERGRPHERGGRALPPAPRGALHLQPAAIRSPCSSTRGSPWSASCPPLPEEPPLPPRPPAGPRARRRVYLGRALAPRRRCTISIARPEPGHRRARRGRDGHHHRPPARGRPRRRHPARLARHPPGLIARPGSPRAGPPRENAMAISSVAPRHLHQAGRARG